MTTKCISEDLKGPPLCLDAEERADFFESILDAMPEFIIYYDNNLDIIWANRAAAADSENTKDEMVGGRFFETACKVNAPCPGCPVVKGLSSEKMEIIESNVYEGRLFYTRTCPVENRDGRLPGRLFVAQDVSHLKNRYSVNEVLNLISEVFYAPKRLSDMCQEIICAIARRFDYPTGYITLYNDKRKEIVVMGEIDLSERPSLLLKSLPCSQCFSWKAMENGRVVNVTGLSKVEDFGGYILKEAGAETVLAVPLSVQEEFLGAIILIDFKERLESSLMVDGLRAVANRLGVEIKRKQTEEKLKEERNFTNAVLSNAGPLIVVFDRDGRIVRFNKACERLTGHRDADMIGKSIVDLLVDVQEKALIQSIFPLDSRRRLPHSFETRWLGQDGETRLISWSNSLMENMEDQSIHMVSIGIDISEKRMAEEQAEMRRQQLLQADKMASLGVLASGLAHEVNNPNNFIMMNARILKDAWNDILPILDRYYREYSDFTLSNIPYSEMREEIANLFEGIQAGSERIKEIVLNMKSYAKRERSKRSQSIDMKDIVNATVGLLSHEIKNSTQSIRIYCAKDVPYVKGNPQRLEQVLVNLIQNACQSLPDSNRAVSIRTCYDEETSEVVVSVEDEGTGIQPEHIDQIFDPFFTTKSDRGGTGLGLSVCASIVKEHGGRLEVTSETGKGTRACVYLPAMPASHKRGDGNDG